MFCCFALCPDDAKHDPMVEGGESEECFLIKGPLNTFNLYTIRMFREMVFQPAGRGADGCTA